MKIKRSDFFYIIYSMFIFIICFRSGYLEKRFSFLAISMAMVHIVVLLFFIIIGLSIMLKFHKRFHKVTYLGTAVLGMILLSTLINGGDIFVMAVTYSRLLVVMYALEGASKEPQKVNIMLRTWRFLMLMVIFIDMFTEIAFPNGLYASETYTLNWFLGYKTNRGVISFPLCFFSLALDYWMYKKTTWRFHIIMFISIVNSWLAQGTSLMLTFVFIELMVIVIEMIYWRKKRGIISKAIVGLMDIKFFLALYIILIGLTILQNNQKVMSLVSEITGKSLTFSGRTYIWERCLEYYMRSPIIGRGFVSSAEYAMITGTQTGVNAHNMVLTLLISGGLVGALLYLGLLVVTLKNAKDTSIMRLQMVAFIFGFLLNGIASSTLVFSTYAFVIYWLFFFVLNEKIGNEVTMAETKAIG